MQFNTMSPKSEHRIAISEHSTSKRFARPMQYNTVSPQSEHTIATSKQLISKHLHCKIETLKIETRCNTMQHNTVSPKSEHTIATSKPEVNVQIRLKSSPKSLQWRFPPTQKSSPKSFQKVIGNHSVDFSCNFPHVIAVVIVYRQSHWGLYICIAPTRYSSPKSLRV